MTKVYIAYWDKKRPAKVNFLGGEGKKEANLRCIVGVYTDIGRAIKSLVESARHFQLGTTLSEEDLKHIEYDLNLPNPRARIAEIRTGDTVYCFAVQTADLDENSAGDPLFLPSDRPYYGAEILYDPWKNLI